MSEQIGKVIGTRISMLDHKQRLETNAMIRGGPVVDEFNQVIGKYPNETIPIHRVTAVMDNNGE